MCEPRLWLVFLHVFTRHSKNAGNLQFIEMQNVILATFYLSTVSFDIFFRFEIRILTKSVPRLLVIWSPKLRKTK